MKKYYTLSQKTKADYWEDVPLTPHLTVYEPDSQHEFSGLYDAEGRELYSTTRCKIGFIKDDL